jgi:hypothetical protein
MFFLFPCVVVRENLFVLLLEGVWLQRILLSDDTEGEGLAICLVLLKKLQILFQAVFLPMSAGYHA